MIKTLFCLLMLFTPLTTIQVTSKLSSRTIVFVGTLERIGPDPGILSGDLAVYRLAKYRVQHVCNGEYHEKEIVVDHLVLTGKEFEGIKVGDQVCVSVEKSKKVFARFNAEGIRGPKDIVKTFFVGSIVITNNKDLTCASCLVGE